MVRHHNERLTLEVEAMKERGDLKQAHHDTLVSPLQPLEAGQQGLQQPHRDAPVGLLPVCDMWHPPPPPGWRHAAAGLHMSAFSGGDTGSRRIEALW